jgi:hypothetical protein
LFSFVIAPQKELGIRVSFVFLLHIYRWCFFCTSSFVSYIYKSLGYLVGAFLCHFLSSCCSYCSGNPPRAWDIRYEFSFVYICAYAVCIFPMFSAASNLTGSARVAATSGAPAISSTSTSAAADLPSSAPELQPTSDPWQEPILDRTVTWSSSPSTLPFSGENMVPMSPSNSSSSHDQRPQKFYHAPGPLPDLFPSYENPWRVVTDPRT